MSNERAITLQGLPGFPPKGLWFPISQIPTVGEVINIGGKYGVVKVLRVENQVAGSSQGDARVWVDDKISDSLLQNFDSARPESHRMKLEAKIDDGYYADVWRATDKLGRTVAVKILRRKSPEHTDAMLHAQALAKVNHTNVVTVYSLETVVNPETDEDVDGIVMEYINGPTLEARFLQGLLEPQEAFLLCEGLIEGLQAIHAAGIPHADLHEKNILIMNSEVKIIDILYTNSLLKMNTLTREEKFRRDRNDLTIILCDIVQHSKIPQDVQQKFRLGLQSSTMSIDEIRNVLRGFANKSEGTHKNILENQLQAAQKYRAERLKAIVERKFLIDWNSSDVPQIIFHGYPLSNETPLEKEVVRKKIKEKSLFRPIGHASGWNYTYYRTGMATYSPEHSYCFISNNCACEAVDSVSFGSRAHDTKKYFPTRFIEEYFAKIISDFLIHYKETGLSPPFYFGFAITDLQDYYLGVSDFFQRESRKLGEAIMEFPEIIVPQFEVEPYALLRSGFDELWQAAGYERCFHYNEHGIYQKERR